MCFVCHVCSSLPRVRGLPIILCWYSITSRMPHPIVCHASNNTSLTYALFATKHSSLIHLCSQQEEAMREDRKKREALREEERKKAEEQERQQKEQEVQCMPKVML